MNTKINITSANLVKYNKALALQNKNKYRDAIKIYNDLRKTNKNQFLIEVNLASCHYNLNSFKEAVEIFHTLHENNPENLNIINSCAISYMQLGNYEVAIRFLKKLVNKDPKNIHTWMNLTFCSARLRMHTEAIYYATQALSLNPKDPNAFNNMGSALQGFHRYEDSLICFKTALDLDPSSTVSLANTASAYEKLGRLSECIDIFEQALSKTKLGSLEEAEFKYRMSFPLLTTGNLKRGWEYYENGFSVGTLARTPHRTFKKPKWNGENIFGKKLMVWREQGLGDEVWFYSLINEVLPQCGKLIIECTDRLETILQRSFPDCEVREQTYNPLTLNTENEDFDYQIPVGSLCKFFKSDPLEIKRPRGYLTADASQISKFKSRLTKYQNKLLVGLSWRSGELSTERNIHYVPISEWENILKINDIQFINLQYGNCSEELNNVKKHFDIDILNWEDIDLKNDLEALAGIISNLDLVISPTSFAAGFAPALGIPTKIVAHTHWGMLGESTWPWSSGVDFYTPASRVAPISSTFENLHHDLLKIVNQKNNAQPKG